MIYFNKYFYFIYKSRVKSSLLSLMKPHTSDIYKNVHLMKVNMNNNHENSPEDFHVIYIEKD